MLNKLTNSFIALKKKITNVLLTQKQDRKIFGPICVPVLLTMRIAFGSADSGCSTRFMEMENAYKINCMFSIISRLLQSLFPVV